MLNQQGTASGKIRRAVPGITQQNAGQPQFRELETDGLIRRTIFAGRMQSPPPATGTQTRIGRGLYRGGANTGAAAPGSTDRAAPTAGPESVMMFALVRKSRFLQRA